ncbi:MAG: ABC transporter ATP-binding protein/permease [Gammaproteobacteria bacterium]
MNEQHVLFGGLNWNRFVRGGKKFMTSEVGSEGKALFALLIAFLFAISGLNVVNSYVGRDFMTAIENRSMEGFIRLAFVYIGVFAASTVVAVIYRFFEERLGLLWREWLTRRLVTRYLDHRTYYYLDEICKLANPDERIADDVRAFTVTTLSFVLMLLNGTITVVAFSGVLWSISPFLFVVGVLYAAGGSFLTVILGRRLVRLNHDQLDKEANFRAGLIHVRENAESVALLRRKERLEARLLRHLDDLVANLRRIIGVNRNLGFFTTGYSYLIQIIPALIVAPLFIRGEIEFGVITQSSIAFAHLLGAFSLIVTQFQSISSFAAVIARLGSLMEAIDEAKLTEASAIEVSEEGGRVAYERLTLRSPQDGRILVKELSISIPHRTRVLIIGPNDTALAALFRATAGIWNAGEGRIIRPSLDQILFLPERPYLPPGTLRELLLRPGQMHVVPDDQNLTALSALDLDPVLARAGGLDVGHDWDDMLSLGEQRLIAFTRVIFAAPEFAFLDRLDTTLKPAQVERCLKMLSERSITYVTLGNGVDRVDHYDAVLELAADGGWKFVRS